MSETLTFIRIALTTILLALIANIIVTLAYEGETQKALFQSKISFGIILIIFIINFLILHKNKKG